MPKADLSHTTNLSRRVLFGAALAAAAVPAAALPAVASASARPAIIPLCGGKPSAVHDIGIRIHALVERHDEIDAAWLTMPEPSQAAEAAEDAAAEILKQIDELEDAALVAPAVTLADAAVQSAVCFELADTLVNCSLSAAQQEKIGRRLARAQASILLCISRATGLSLDSIGWTDLESRCRSKLRPHKLTGGTLA